MEPPANFFPSKEELIKLVLVLSIASAVAVSCNFFVSFVNPQSKPFCDTDLDSSYLAPDSCEPCPSHGECRKGELECHQGYRKQGKLCIEDGDINLTAKQLAEWVESHLCRGYAQLMCYGSGASWALEEDLLNNLDRQLIMRNSDQDSAVYTYTKQRAVETIAKSLETRTNSAGTKEFKCPDTFAENYKPFGCRIRHWIIERSLLLMPVCALCLGFAVLMWRIYKKHCLTTRAEELYNQVCEILEENALVSNRGHGESEPWVVASRLRDHLLLPRERKNPLIWRKVEELVQEDSRVDRYPKLVKGESRVVWEWQVEGSLSSTRIRKKRETGNLNTVNQIRSGSDQHYESKSEPGGRALIF